MWRQVQPVDEIDGSVQDCSNSSANALELLQFYTKPSRLPTNKGIRLWTQKRHFVPRPRGWAMDCLLWVIWRKKLLLYRKPLI